MPHHDLSVSSFPVPPTLADTQFRPLVGFLVLCALFGPPPFLPPLTSLWWGHLSALAGALAALAGALALLGGPAGRPPFHPHSPPFQ